MRADDIKHLLTILGSDPRRMRLIEREFSEVQAECPLAVWNHPKGRDRSRGFGVLISEASPSKYKCFGCAKGSGTGGLNNLISAWEHFSGQRIPEAWSFFKLWDVPNPMAEDSLPDYTGTPFRKFKRTVEVPSIPEEWLEGFMDHIPRYLIEQRGISEEAAREMGVRYDPREDRVVFPIRRADGALVGMVGRACRESASIPWKNYIHLPRQYILAYEDQLRPGGSVAVVEGLTDLSWLRQCGAWNTVATLGAKVTKYQIDRLAKLDRPLVLLFDDDTDGWDARDRIVNKLAGRVSVRAPLYPGRKEREEPTDLTREDLIRMLSESADNLNPDA